MICDREGCDQELIARIGREGTPLCPSHFQEWYNQLYEMTNKVLVVYVEDLIPGER